MKQECWLDILGNIDDAFIEEALLASACAAFSPAKKEMQNMKRKKNITWSLGRLAAVIALILALGITAYASGFVESFIAKMADAWAVYDPVQGARYEAAGEKSDKEAQTQKLEKQESTSMTLEESYYDGESLMIVYSLDSVKVPVSFDFGPESEQFEKLEKRSGMTLETIQTSYGIPEEDYRAICEKLNAHGAVGFRIRQTGLGDHVLLTDGTDLGPMMSMERDGKRFLECQDGLPEAAKKRDQLELVFKINCWDVFFYVKGESVSVYHPVPQSETVTFTVDNCEAES